MISYIWHYDHPFRAGAGGTENFTAGHIRELLARGIPARIITVGHGTHDGREGFPDIPFLAIDQIEAISALDDTLIFATPPEPIPTRRQAYAMLHCPLTLAEGDATFYPAKDAEGKKLIAPSKFAARLWAPQLGRRLEDIPVVYPFADAAFRRQPISKRATGQTKVLFASRLSPDKGIYTLLAALHFKLLRDAPLHFTVTTSGAHTKYGKIIHDMLAANPMVTVVPAQSTTTDMAALLAGYDVVVMPSVASFWQESFGMLSVEAQHAGCRVVASNSGGLSETDCGGLILVKPEDPLALAKGIVKAAQLGRLTATERKKAAQKFTVEQSVDALLRVVKPDADGVNSA